MSIASQCSECCECPDPSVQWDSVPATTSKCGWAEFGTASTPPKIYRTKTLTNFYYAAAYSDFDPLSGTITGSVTLPADCDYSVCDTTIGVTVTDGVTSYSVSYIIPVSSSLVVEIASSLNPDDSCGRDFMQEDDLDSASPTTVNSTVLATYAGYGVGGTDATAALSDEYTTAELVAQSELDLPAYDDDWNDTAGSYRNLATNETSIAIREARYRIRFKIPKTRFGKCYRATWVERFIPEAGTTLTSVEVYSAGVYRPEVEVGGSGGAVVVAVMTSAGAVGSVNILHPGSGYDPMSPPTITFSTAVNGGTTATATATISDGGLLESVTVGTAGNYLPQLSVTGGSGSGATATCTMDAQGGIASVSVTSGGSAYTSAPTIAITARGPSSAAADLLVHLGTETDRCANWDGSVPEDYDPDDSTTYPTLGEEYYELAVPENDGTVLVANLRAVCDCSECS